MWIANSRANTYSRNHTHKNPNKKDFWNFTFVEMGLFDLPATIDYILNQTGHPQLYFVGHSQGTTNLMVLLSEKPEYNKFIVAASLLAPVAYLGHSNYIFQTLAQISPLLMVIQKKINFYEKKLFIKIFRRGLFHRNFCPDVPTLMY